MRTFVIAAMAAVSAPALAGGVATGPVDSNMIVGMTPTADGPIIGGGNPLFFPSADKSGVVALITDYGPQVGRFICSGSLLTDRVSIVTAGHCVTRAANPTLRPVSVTAYFFTGDPNERTPFSPNARTVGVSRIMINENYTRQVVDHNDIAVLRLSEAVFGVNTYEITTLDSLRGQVFNVAGYGGRSSVGGGGPTGGVNANTGFLREGNNRFDYRMGDPIFSQIPGNGWQTVYPNNPNIAFSYHADFDSGFAENSMTCRVAQATNLAGPAGVVFCDTGVGAREVGVAGGDSGGPAFINGQIAAITYYGSTFGVGFGDCRAGLQSSCGEISGFVPLYIHRDFIANAMAVPEPATWGLLIAGFGLVGAAARRRTRAAIQ